jgi:murein DD-endopeptidase MepM/ murein hydrolase activator NlpD
MPGRTSIAAGSLVALALLLPACAGEVAETSVTPDAAPAADARHGLVTGTGGIGLNLRAAPDLAAEVIAVIPEGAAVDILAGPDGDWYQIRYQEQVGFAFAEFLHEIDDDDSGTGTGGVLNLLPWSAGVAFAVTQGHNTGSHVGNDSWAWDFGLPAGTPVVAAHNGTVRTIRSGSTSGCCSSACANQANLVVVMRGDGTESLYLHLSRVDVAPGQAVVRGDLLGASGATGWACGAHLHFQMQSSPGGGEDWYQPSVEDEFHDIGEPFDPAPGTTVTSQNGALELP